MSGAWVAESNRRGVLAPSPVDLFGGGADELALALRKAPRALTDLQQALVAAGVDVLLAPTAATTAPALHRTGQAYRAAALTAAAVELSREATLGRAGAQPADAPSRDATRTSPWVYGEVPALPGARDQEEALLHVERLVEAAVDGLWVDAVDQDTTRAVLRAAAAHRLPAVVEVDEERLEVADAIETGSVAMIVVRGAVPQALEHALHTLRIKLSDVPFGARLAPAASVAENDAIAVVQAWWALPHDGLVALGVGGTHAAASARALGARSRQ